MTRKLCAVFFALLLGTVLFLTFFAFYTCKGTVCFGATDISMTNVQDYEAFLDDRLIKHKFGEDDLLRVGGKVDLEGEDVLVYLHIQKTGGATFGRHLVHDLVVDPPCLCKDGVKKCECITKNKRVWLFSRHSTGWVCGLHADWTELNGCVDKWFQKADIVSRRKFRRHNLAFNRMTRMLSNLSRVNCYNRTGLDEDLISRTLVKSAKENLLDFAFFGIVEEQEKTQFLFEQTFGLKFKRVFQQKQNTHVERLNVSQEMRDVVIRTNRPDIELYQFAKDLFYQRVETMEKRLGYSVEEYFDHYREADGKLMEEEEAEEELEDDSGMQYGKGDEERLKHYPGEVSVTPTVSGLR
ncbi:cohesin subunit sa-1 [Plakobranchus ocellatus]|uniref:Heparan-sulfate 6-O-sulfotransferase n=1 Tax=Plakobranchus ocellatus TaxID=259542 RepID=A0AAV3Z498_9GAST|nr:cohesin subunit sa-1 [Plakobranchus ocellatus]